MSTDSPKIVLKKEHLYFKGLDGLRALAAVGVLISHVFQEQHKLGLSKTGALSMGGYGVTIFFTLSGFLITYLLLKEIENAGSIDIKAFYMRRVLRIWPLYFFYLIACILIYTFLFDIPSKHLEYLFLFVLFLPNIAFNLNTSPPGTGHLWSIGIEEQFYIFWPWIVRKFKNLQPIFIFIIVVLIGLKAAAILFGHAIDSKLPSSIAACMRYDCMAVGGLFAVMFFKNKEIKFVEKYAFIINAIFFICYLLAFYTSPFAFFSILSDEIISIITGLFILVQITSKSKFQFLELGIFKFLGKLSFGIYVYHVLVISFFRYILYDQFHMNFGNTGLLTLLVLVATVVVAYISFNTLENYFLKIKKKFSH